METNILPDLKINTDLARTLLTSFLRTEISRMGFSRAVVGLSGGVDSALSCFLAAEALGPQNVLAVRMPYKSSNPRFAGARPAGDRRGWACSPLLSRSQRWSTRSSRIFADINDRRKGNVMARERMIVL